MKKIYSLFIMLALLCLSWPAKAQETLTVYEGTVTSNYVPAYVFYFDDFTRSQVVFPATDLAEMDGGTINSVTFYTTSYNIPYTTVSTVDVYLMEVGYTTISAYEPKESATIVYQGTLSFVSADDGSGILTIEFSSPYTYNGGNLLIGIDNTTDAGWKNMNFYGLTVEGASIAGSNGSDPSAAPATQRNFIPMTTFEYTPAGGVTCAKPTGFNVSDVQAHGATLTWNPGDDASSWIISCIHGDEEDLIETGENSYTFTDLIPETSYTVKVSAYCGGGNYSSWTSNKSFTTLIACPAPTDLTASLTPGDGSVADLSWTPFGGTTSWILQYGTDNSFETFDDEVYVDGTPATTLYGLTAETTYYARVKADCGSEDGESTWSNTVSFQPTEKTQIGSGTATNNYLPLNNYYKYSLTEQIYTVEELGDAGAITSIDFYKNGTNSCERDLDIYMISTDKNSFEDNTDWVSVTEGDLVFSGTVNFTNNAWTTITLDNEFVYDGANNVIIIVDDNTGSYTSTTPFLSFPATAQAIRAYYDNYDFDPTDPSGITSSYNRGVESSKNQIRILKEALAGCPKPTGLTVTDIGPHSAVLSWTQAGEAYQWEIFINGDETTPIPAYEIPFTLDGLDPETDYTVTVRALCGGGEISNLSNPVTFTTTVACPAPTDVVVSEVGPHSAELSWTGFSDSYEVQYRIAGIENVIFLEDFESGIPSNWTTIDDDGDGYNWYGVNMDAIYCHSGTGIATSESYYNATYTPLTPDNWLITPLLDLQGTMRVWLRGQDPSYAAEHFAIYLSTTGNAVSDFTITLVPETETTGEYVEYTADLSDYAGQQGYIAIRHFNCTDMFRLNVDDFGIFSEATPAGDWMTATTDNTTVTIEGLDPETVYEVRVIGDCGSEGYSAPSSVKTFTTNIACPAPTDIIADETTAYSTNLSWTGYSEQYTINYRIAEDIEVFFFDSFEDGLYNWTTIRNADGTDVTDWQATDPSYLSYEAVSGDYVATSRSWASEVAYAVDNWLISPQVPLNGTLRYWVRDDYPDHYDVYVSTTTNDMDAFSLLYEPGAPTEDWTEHSVDLSGFDGQMGYIAFRHTDEDQDMIFLDNFGIYGNEVPAGDWMTATSTTTTALLQGLAPETTYEVKIQGDCGIDGTSQMSESFFFTTEEATCIAPTDLEYAEGSITYNSIFLSWTEYNPGANAWQISINNDEENLVNANENGFLLTSLTPYSEYIVKVRTVCDEGVYSDWSNELIFITEPCPVPTGLAATEITKTTALLSWDENSDVFGWQLMLNDDEDHIMDVNVNPFLITDLTPSTDYAVKLRAICSEQSYSDWSEAANFITVLACSAPTELTVEEITSGSAMLSWLGEGINYNIRYKLADGEWTEINEEFAPYPLENLQPGTEYFFQVQANCDEFGLSEWSDLTSFTTLECPVPTAVTVSDITKNSALLSWSENGDATVWQLALNGNEDAPYPVTANPFTIPGLEPETEYTVKLRAVCGGGASSEWSEEVTFTTDLACHAPTDLATSDITSGSVNLTWLGEGNDYMLQYKETAEESWIDIEGINTPYTLIGLQPNVAYDVRVMANCGDYGMSLWSETVSFTTLPCPAPTDVTVNDITRNTASVSWIETGDADTWQICFNGDEENLISITTNPYTLTGLNPETEYTVKVRANCGGGASSEWSELVTFETEMASVVPTYVTISGETAICPNGSTTLSVTSDVIGTYTWSTSETGQQITATVGIYTVTVTTQTGDWLADTIEVTAKETYEIFVDSTICHNELPIIWNGITFTSPGGETVTLTAENGCDSIVHMNLIVNPVYTTPLTASICEGESYDFLGELLTEAGFYIDTIPTVNGCDSIITLDLTVNPLPIVTISGETSFCQDGSTTLTAEGAITYEWSNEDNTAATIITAADTYTVTGTDANNCSSTAEVTVTMKLPVNTPIAEAICEGQTYIFFDEELTESGEYTHTLTAANGCDSVITLTLTVNELPNVTISGDNEFCQGESTTLTATGAETYVWSTEATTAAINVNEADTYTVIGTDANNCSNTAEVTVIMNLPASTPLTAAICAGESYTFFGEELTETGEYTHTLETVHGCDSVITLTLTVNTLPTVTISGDNEFCQGESTTLTATGAVSYVWSTTATTAAINVDEAETYTVTGTDANNCSNTATVTVTMNMPSTGIDVQVACDSYIWIDGQTYTASTNTPTFTLTNAVGCDSVVTLNLTINNSVATPISATICQGESYEFFGQVLTTAGEYTHTLQAANGCDSVITLTLAVNPTFNTPVPATICEGEVYEFFGQELSTAGIYTHTLQAITGCDSVITLTLTINPTFNTPVTAAICEGSSYDFFGQELNTAGVYTHTLQAVTGCDSVITLTLTVNPITTGIDEQTACDSYTWIDGQTYTASTNTPTYTLTNAMGCDSVVTLHLTINNSVTTEFTIETNEGCYTWNGTEYCQSGDYTQNLQTVAGCDSVVTLHLTVGVGIENHEVTIAYLTPNPATNTCRIVGLDTDPVSVDLYDMNGKLVRRPNTTEFDVSTLPTGIYMVRVTTDDNRIINLKMMKR